MLKNYENVPYIYIQMMVALKQQINLRASFEKERKTKKKCLMKN